jgi:hypothetical protein
MEHVEKTTKRGKTNGYNSTILHRKRDERRRDAEARQQSYEDLTLKQRLERAQGRRGESKVEVARIEALIKVEKGKKHAN